MESSPLDLQAPPTRPSWEGSALQGTWNMWAQTQGPPSPSSSGNGHLLVSGRKPLRLHRLCSQRSDSPGDSDAAGWGVPREDSSVFTRGARPGLEDPRVEGRGAQEGQILSQEPPAEKDKGT